MLNDRSLPKAWQKLNELENNKFDKSGGSLTGDLIAPNLTATTYLNLKDYYTKTINSAIWINKDNSSYSPMSIYIDSVTDLFLNRTNKVYHTNNKPTKSDVGLSNVNNWGASSAHNDTSTSTYATTLGVKTAYDKGIEALNRANLMLVNPGFGGVHEFGRYLDLHLENSTADFDTRLACNSDKSLLIQNSFGSLEIGSKNSSHCHVYTTNGTFYFNKELLVNGSKVFHTGNFNPGTKLDVNPPYFGINNTAGSTGYGISLYGNAVGGKPTYGLMFSGTGTFGTHGSVLGDWATYFTMDGAANRGWIFKHANSNVASICSNGDITGARVFNAVWNDYAEYFPKLQNYKTEPGDIIALSLTDDDEHYELATEEHNLIVGVHSDQYGHLIGGDKVPDSCKESFEDYNNKKYIPVGLVGRLPVKFIGEAKKGMKVVPSEIAGVGRKFDSKKDDYDKVIGYIVENNNEPGIRKVKIKIGK